MGVLTDQEIDAALEGFYDSIACYTNVQNNTFSIGISRELLRSYPKLFPVDRIMTVDGIKISGVRATRAKLQSFRCIKCMSSKGDDFYRDAATEVAELFQKEFDLHPDSDFWFYQPAVYCGTIIDPATFEPRIAIRSRYAKVPKRRE